MKKWKERFQDYLYTQSTNESIYFTQFEQTILDENRFNLRVGFVLFPVLYLIIVLISFLTQKSVDSFIALFLIIPEQILYHIYYHDNKHSQQEYTIDPNYRCLLYFVIAACQIILVDTVVFRHIEGLWFHNLLVVFALVFTTQFTDYLLIYSILSAFYIIMLFSMKDIKFVGKDILNVSVAYFVGLACARIVCNIRNAKARQNHALREQSSYDKLTGLLNKGAAKKEIEEYFANRPENETAVVISIDADNFKQINDKLGHTAGDIVLSNIGAILKNSFRVDDIVARNGGDEFLVVMKGVVPPFHIDMICRRIQKSVADIKVDGGWPFTCSIGIVIDKYYHDFETIFAMADDALYECKIRGRDCFSEWFTYNFEYNNDRPLVIISYAIGQPHILEYGQTLKNDYNVVYAETGNEVLNLASQYNEAAAVLVLDMTLQKIPAAQVLEYIKQRPHFAHIKVIAICPTSNEYLKAQKSTADAVLPVPFEYETLTETIEKVLKP